MRSEKPSTTQQALVDSLTKLVLTPEQYNQLTAADLTTLKQAIQEGFCDYQLAHPRPSMNTLGRWAASFFTGKNSYGRGYVDLHVEHMSSPEEVRGIIQDTVNAFNELQKKGQTPKDNSRVHFLLKHLSVAVAKIIESTQHQATNTTEQSLVRYE